MTRLFVVASLAGAIPQAMAWGAMAHQAVAYVATNFVSDTTKTYMQNLLGDTTDNYLANVAPWADSFRKTPEGAFSANLHYIDALDSPPTSCNVDFDRDCGESGCIISAISNYTTRLLTTSLSTSERQMAAKWVIHFLGDIGQPLHCENLEAGGNGINVTYDGESTNLHTVWDSKISEHVAGGSTQAIAKSWAAKLTAEIKSGSYKCSARKWLAGQNIAHTQKSAVKWASESNAFVCTAVMPGGVMGLQNIDLSGAYTAAAAPVIRLQVAKQGYRLAKWLDAIVAALQ